MSQRGIVGLVQRLADGAAGDDVVDIQHVLIFFNFFFAFLTWQDALGGCVASPGPEYACCCCFFP